jgi:transposase
MEACGGAHHWARQLLELGHEVGLMAPQFVRPWLMKARNAQANQLRGLLGEFGIALPQGISHLRRRARSDRG